MFQILCGGVLRLVLGLALVESPSGNTADHLRDGLNGEGSHGGYRKQCVSNEDDCGESKGGAVSKLSLLSTNASLTSSNGRGWDAITISRGQEEHVMEV